VCMKARALDLKTCYCFEDSKLHDLHTRKEKKMHDSRKYTRVCRVHIIFYEVVVHYTIN
jgi:hypothetical protein